MRFTNIPPLLQAGEGIGQWEERRAVLLELFEQIEYGHRPDLPWELSWTTGERKEVLDGTAWRQIVELSVQTALGSHTFPLYLFLPKKQVPSPAVLLICSRSREASAQTLPEGVNQEMISALMRRLNIIMDGTLVMEPAPGPLDLGVDLHQEDWPVVSIIERGYAVAAFYASDAEPDSAKAFPSGIASLFSSGGERGRHDWGALAVWAFAASRAMDYLLTVPEIDAGHIGVFGHSRCGKAALWAGACDERFWCVGSNDSGCGGSALSRDKHGENVAAINLFFPHWFAPAFAEYGGKVEELPFDQHMLLALAAPRLLYIASGSEDYWSDPEGEHWAAVLANEVWHLYGYSALGSRMPQLDAPVFAGPEGYHLRSGNHRLTKYDWMRLLDHMDRGIAAERQKQMPEKTEREGVE